MSTTPPELSPEELKQLREILQKLKLLTPDEVEHLKALIEDRKAVNLVWGKFKLYLFGAVAAVTAYIALFEKILNGLKH